VPVAVDGRRSRALNSTVKNPEVARLRQEEAREREVVAA